ncbi:UNVERIFIED_CONTAM: hypothetical protein RMT77_010876 [Armadillidium vulgare]
MIGGTCDAITSSPLVAPASLKPFSRSSSVPIETAERFPPPPLTPFQANANGFASISSFSSSSSSSSILSSSCSTASTASSTCRKIRSSNNNNNNSRRNTFLVKSASTSALVHSRSSSVISSVSDVDDLDKNDMKKDCEAIRLPENLESISRAEHFPTQRHRWNTNEEIAALLISFDKHNDWLSKEVKIRPKSGSMLLYSRKKVRYRRDGYCWKKRKDGKTTREDHMKLKVQGIECIYGCYVHSAILPTFHRRCYWLLQNPDIVLVHYLNVPYPDDNKLIMASSISLWADKKEWTKEELISQLKPMFFSEEEPDINNEIEISKSCGDGRGYSHITKTAETVEAIVGQLMEKQRVARAAAASASKASIECACGTGVGGEHSKHCTHHPLRRLTIAKLPQQQSQPQQQQQQHHHPNHPVQTAPTHHHQNNHHQQQQQQQQQQQPPPQHTHHPHSHPHHSHHPDAASAAPAARKTLMAHPTSSDHDLNQVSSTSGSAPRYQGVTPEGSHRPQQSFTPTPSSPSPNTTSTNNNNSNNNINNNNNNNKSIDSTENLADNDDSNKINSNSNNNCNTNNNNNNVNSNSSNSNSSNCNSNNNNNNNNNNSNTLSSAAAPLILNLSNIQGGGGLLILNSGSHTGGHGHSQHPLAAPFTLTSYFGQPHVVTSTANGGRLPHAHVLHSLHHQQHPHSVHSVHHQQPMQIQYPHHQQQHNHHSNHQHHHHSTVLVKRESKEDAVESLRLDVTNGNLTMDSGTFASLVSSLEASENQNKGGQRESSLVGESGSIKAELAADMSIVKEELFVDTLTLSPEDIQKTLSANLPPHNPIPKSPHSADDNPMDFIDSNMPSAEDDVLANLDAFDMLSDFPDLEHYDTSPPDNLNSNHSNSSASSSTNVSGKSVTNQSQQTLRIDYRENSSNISDYSPEWAYPEGGVKVLVTGPWYSSTSPYTVLFDGVPTPTTLVQAGVLRCYCPAHEAGLVTLQVACDGFVISNSVIFEYKKPPVDANSVKEEEGVQEQDEHLLKFTLLQRLESIETRVQTQSDSNGQDNSTAYENDLMLHKSSYFQDRVVLRCQRLSRLPWLSGANSLASLPPTKESPLRKGQTILHLAARLGYTRLIVCLLRWREENASLALELEVDALRKDGKGRTPLSWACLEGHKDSALILYRWNPQVVKSTDNQGMTPLKLAEINGHDNLLEELTHREEETHKSSSQCSSLSQLRKSSSSSHVSSSFSSSSSSSHSLNSTSNDLSVTNVTSDGFLRPSPRRSDLRKHRHLSVDFPIGGETDIGRGGNSSPALSWSEGLKRGRIIKRPSVDSGINLVSVDSFKRASLDSGLDILQKHSRNVSCCQTPLEDSSPLEDTSDDGNFPLHFDYFRGNGEKAPKDSEPEEELRQSFEGGSDSTAAADMSTPDDSRVFTLAEQIIAAIPERIKGDEEDVTDLLSPCLTEPPSTDLSMEVILDESPDSNAEFNFEFSDIMSYRYMDVSTPSSSLSPASSTCLPSPASFPLDSPSPPPTTADFSEFFQASTRDFSKDFSNLTLSDQEQRELYEAAKIIQKAYRLYKGRKRQQAEKDKERQAAVLIQNYYRRYKQYAYFRQMSKAATLIQTQFRSYCETKRFKKSQETANKYNLRSSREGTPVPNLKRSYSQRRQHQAARKIQQFMRQTKQKLQRERAQAAEREKSGQGSAPHPIGPPNLGARRAPSPVLPHSLPLRGVPGVHSSELSRRVTDPLLSATAHLPHRTEEEKTGEYESL